MSTQFEMLGMFKEDDFQPVAIPAQAGPVTTISPKKKGVRLRSAARLFTREDVSRLYGLLIGKTDHYRGFHQHGGNILVVWPLDETLIFILKSSGIKYNRVEGNVSPGDKIQPSGTFYKVDLFAAETFIVDQRRAA